MNQRMSRPSIKSNRIYAPKLYKVIKKFLLIAIILSTLSVNGVLLFNVLDYLNKVLTTLNLESLESGIVTGLCFLSIVYELIGMFSVIKEEIPFVVIYLIILSVGSLLSLLIYCLILIYNFDGLFAINMLVNVAVIILGSAFCFLITIDRKTESEIDSLNFRNQQLAKRVEILQVHELVEILIKFKFFQTVQEKGNKKCTSLRFPVFMHKG